MLIAQCTMQPDSADGFRRQGDILVLVFPDHPWGTQDMKRFARVEWDDPAIEAALQARRNRGERFPVRTLPYSSGQTKQSSVSIDLADLQQKGLIPLSRGGDSDIPVVSADQYVLRSASLEEVLSTVDPEPLGVWGTIKNAVVSAWNWMVG